MIENHKSSEVELEQKQFRNDVEMKPTTTKTIDTNELHRDQKPSVKKRNMQFLSSTSMIGRR